VTIRYGGDYNPEQWPEDVWLEDVRLMREAGVNFVTVGVFSWALLEPADGRFDFAWLDRVLDLLHANGIGVDLATATASPPAWLTAAHPEMLPEDADGVRRWPGSRQHYSPTSPVYRRHAARLVRAMAERYGKHPAVEMWHVNNEYGCHTNLDFSDDAAVAFRGWLRARYGSIDALNDAWGTRFWSQVYGSFDEVLPPRTAPNFRNPTQLLDFRRFSSDALLECFLLEKAIVREVSPDIPVTTNFIGAFKPVDYWSWAPHVDVISDDNYADPGDPRSPMLAAFSRDLMRSLGGGEPWLLMEQATSHVQWRRTNLRKRSGQMRALSLQAVSRGADGVNFFQWRQSVSGAEKFHSAMVPHAGTDTRIWRSVVELGEGLRDLGSVSGTRVDARVAIVLDWDSWWAVEAGAHPQTLDYLDTVHSWYEALYGLNVAVDVVHTGADLEGYSLVVAPQLYLLGEEGGVNLARFVERGGTLVVTYYSAIVDRDDRAHLDGYLGALRPVLGIRIEEFSPLPLDGDSRTIGVRSAAFGDFDGTIWSEFVEVDAAAVVAVFAEGDLEGSAAVTRNAHGSGAAWYVATQPPASIIRTIVARLLDDAGIEPVVRGLAAGVEAQRRGDVLFVINQTDAVVETALGGLDLLSSTRSDAHTLGPFGAVALREVTAGSSGGSGRA
jgi:beta-galactosidase